jgi:hypothetical protein
VRILRAGLLRALIAVTYVLVILPVGLIMQRTSDRLGLKATPGWRVRDRDESPTETSGRQY